MLVIIIQTLLKACVEIFGHSSTKIVEENEKHNKQTASVEHLFLINHLNFVNIGPTNLQQREK